MWWIPLYFLDLAYILILHAKARVHDITKLKRISGLYLDCLTTQVQNDKFPWPWYNYSDLTFNPCKTNDIWWLRYNHYKQRMQWCKTALAMCYCAQTKNMIFFFILFHAMKCLSDIMWPAHDLTQEDPGQNVCIEGARSKKRTGLCVFYKL